MKCYHDDIQRWFFFEESSMLLLCDCGSAAIVAEGTSQIIEKLLEELKRVEKRQWR